MPDEFVEVTQAEKGQPAVLTSEPEVKADQTTDGGAQAADTELQKGGEQTTETATEEPGGETTETTETTPPKKEETEVDKRFAVLTKARREAERTAAAEKLRADQAIEALMRLGKEPTKPAEEKPAEDAKPEMPDFSDPETFARDMATYTEQVAMWGARQAVKADRLESEKRRTLETNQQNTARVQSEFAQRRKKALETMPDYADVAENPNLTITEIMASAITIDQEGPAVAYYLGQHPEEADRISKLAPGMQLMEMGAVRATLLASRNAPPRNKLPPPIRPVGNQGGLAKSIDDLDMDAYAAKRNADLAAGSTH